MWGLGGVVQAPEGAIWNLATSAKTDSGPATRDFDNIVLLLGADDVGASKRFYVDRGLTVAKSFGSYVDFATPSSPIGLGLYKRRALAKSAGRRRRGLGLASQSRVKQRRGVVHRPRRVRLVAYAVDSCHRAHAQRDQQAQHREQRCRRASSHSARGFDREIPFMKMPRVKYPKITHMAMTEKGSGNNVDRPEPVERDDHDQRVDEDRRDAADPQSKREYAMLAAPCVSSDRGPECKGGLEDRQHGEDDRQHDGEGHGSHDSHPCACHLPDSKNVLSRFGREG